MGKNFTKKDATNLWTEIPALLKAGLTNEASRDFCALECLANDPLYSKPDTRKIFVLWEAINDISLVSTDTIENFAAKHPWVYSLFTPGNIVRFPLNTWDTDRKKTLSWSTIAENLLVGVSADDKRKRAENRQLQLPRWSTASRSCLVLIPDPANAKPLPSADFNTVDLGQRICPEQKNDAWLNMPEWNAFKAKNVSRFCDEVKDPGEAAAQTGCDLTSTSADGLNGRFRLYSIKTGVKYVGSKDESVAGKDRLEADSALAMVRSRVINAMNNNDKTFGVQTEILTVTAPLEGQSGVRDGFQVRDLSCMKPALNYIPGQAIPYAREAFDGKRKGDVAGQCAFWRNAFAVPLGRAKARLFLNYGLIHQSANAQNFLLGFNGDALKQFVVRDIGDMSWHDEYLNRCRGYVDMKPVLTHFDKESKSLRKQTLYESSDRHYPPPRIVRLAANSVLTHDFAKTLEKHGWGKEHVYEFATGILDGFREFVQEALQLKPEVDAVQLDDQTIKDYGVTGKYPTDMPKLEAYCDKVNELLKKEAKALFGSAQDVRRRGKEMVTDPAVIALKGSGEDDHICTLLNAEELLLCAGFEVLLGTAPNPPIDCKNPVQPQPGTKRPSLEVKIGKELATCLEKGWPAIVK